MGHIGYVWNSTDDAAYSNECQAAELQNNTVLLNARTLLLHRSQAISHDGGLTFAPLDKVESMPQPFDGVEGSTIKHPPTQWLFFSHPYEESVVGLRYNMSLQVSKDYGNTWQLLRQLDAGPSGYSALTVTPSQDVGILYERSNQTRIVFLPQNISYVVAWKYEP